MTTEAETDIGEINNISTEGNRRKTYLYGKVESSQKSCLQQKIMVDSGNTLRGGIGISPEMHRKLGGKWYSRPKQRVLAGTSKQGSGLQVLGTCEEISLKFDGLNKKVLCRPLVIKDLTDEINVGTEALQKFRCTLRFDERGTTFSDMDTNEEVQMIKTIDNTGTGLGPVDAEGCSEPVNGDTGTGLGPVEAECCSEPVIRGRDSKSVCTSPRRREPSIGCRERVSEVKASRDVLLKANSVNFVPVNMRIDGEILIEPLEDAKLVQAVFAAYKNPGKVAVLNLGTEDKTLKKGVTVATATRLKVVPKEDHGDVKVTGEEKTKQLEDLFEQLNLKDNKMLQENPEILKKLLVILEKYQDVFSAPGAETGDTDLVEFEVTLQPGAKPVRQKLRPLNPAQAESLDKQLDGWMKNDVIEESNSPWASALVCVCRAGRSDRWCVDYRYVNSVTVADSYPLPSITENLEKLRGSRIFSTLDAAAAYNAISVKKESRPYLAFTTPRGLFTFRKMPFGPKNAPAAYSRLIEMVLQKLRTPYVLGYLDDVIIHAPDLEIHLRELEKTLEAHKEAGIKLKASKTHLFQSEVNYLGFKITKDGVSMREDYVEKILKWPRPKTIRQLNTFLGFLNYYRTFITKFSYLTNEMNALKRQKKMVWTDLLEKKFQKLKKKFGRRPIRAYPRYDLKAPFELAVDFSAENLSAILSQNQDGKERLIAVQGRKTNSHEKNYGSVKGELAALVYGLRKFEHILRYKPFIAHSDSRALVYLKNIKQLRGIWWRWLQEVSSYEFEIRHRPGKQNKNADAVSRSSHMPPPTAEEEKEPGDYVANIDHVEFSRELLIQAQSEDPVLQKVRKWVAKGPPSKDDLRGCSEDERVYAQQLGVIEDDNGLLILRYRFNKGVPQDRRRALIPPKMRPQVYHFIHQHPTAGHFGRNATTAKAAERFYWPGMAGDVHRFVRDCADCLIKIQQVKLKNTVHHPVITGYPGERLHVDLVGPLPETPQGDKYLLTCQDAFTRFAWAYPIRNKEASTTARILVDKFISVYGCPQGIHSDQGTEFKNELWTEICDRLRIRKTTTPAYNPQSNPVERWHRTLNQLLRVFMDRDDPAWKRHVPMACLAFNTKINASTGVSPFEAFFGRKARLPLDLIFPPPGRRYGSVSEQVKETLDRFSTMYEYMQETNRGVISRNAKLYTGKIDQFQLGDLVWCYTSRRLPGKPLKITDQWTGPYTVVERPSDVIIIIKPTDYEGKKVAVHVSRLSPYRGPKDPRKSSTPLYNIEFLDDEGDEHGEELEGEHEVKEDLRIPVEFKTPEQIMLDLPWLNRAIKKGRGRPTTTKKKKTTEPQTTDEKMEDEAGPSNMKREREESSSDESGSNRIAPDKKPRPADDPGGGARMNPAQTGSRVSLSTAEKRSEAPTDETSVTKKWKQLIDTDSSDDGEMQKLHNPVTMAVHKLPNESAVSSHDLSRAITCDVRTRHTVRLPPRASTHVQTRQLSPRDATVSIQSSTALSQKGVTAESDNKLGNGSVILKNDTDESILLQKGQRIATILLRNESTDLCVIDPTIE